MKKTVHTSQLFNLVRNFANTCDKFLGEYYQAHDLFTTYTSLHSRLNRHRSYDEMKAFLSYNGTNLIEKAPLLSLDQMEAFLDAFVTFYLTDESYDLLKEDDGQNVDLNSLGLHVGIDIIIIHSIKTALQNIEHLDYEGKDALKRVIFKDNILNDKEFIVFLSKCTNSSMQPNSPENLLEYLYTIVEDCVYPHYHFIDECDVREIIFQLAFELTHNTGFFSLRNKFTIIKGSTNKKRCFSLINNYSDFNRVIKLPSSTNGFKSFKGIFNDVDLRLFEDNYGESQINLKKALEKHFVSYHIFNIERSKSKRRFQSLSLVQSVMKSLNSK